MRTRNSQSSNRTGARSLSRGSKSTNQVSNSDDLIASFSGTIANLPPDEWKAKTVALEHLVNEISAALKLEQNQDEENVFDFEELSLSSSTSKQSSTFIGASNSSTFNSRPSSASTSSKNIIIGTNPSILQPKSLRGLSYPFRTLLTDLRALVVKAACATLATLSEMLRNRISLLLKDLLPTILAIHAQTVKVMHGYAQSAMATILSFTKNSKAIVGNLISEIRLNKSKDVRCVSVFYIDSILTHWSKSFFLGGMTSKSKSSKMKNLSSVGNPMKEKPIYLIIGNQLVKSILDPSQQVRIQARNTFMSTFRRKLPSQFEYIINDRDGPLCKDARLKRSIMAQAKQESHLFNAEEGQVDDKVLSVMPPSRSRPASKKSSSSSSSSATSRLPSPSNLSHAKNSRRDPVSKQPSQIRNSSSSQTSMSSTQQPLVPSDLSTPQKFLDTSPSSLSASSLKNPFSSALSPPNEQNKNGVYDSSSLDANNSIQIQNNIRVQSRLKHEAVSLIQAAIRGMITRKRILIFLEQRTEQQLTQGNDDLVYNLSHTGLSNDAKIEDENIENDHETITSSPEMSMLREARRALAKHRYQNDSYGGREEKGDDGGYDHDIDDNVSGFSDSIHSRRKSRLGMTAKEMAVRRRTAGKIEVLPLPPSPSMDAIGAYGDYEGESPSRADNNQGAYTESPSQSEIQSKTDEKEHDSTRSVNQRESMLFTPHAQERKRKPIRQSSILLKNRLHQQSNTPTQVSSASTTSATSEGMQTSLELSTISRELLNVHKQHIDEIMEILNEEMLIVRDFEERLESNEFGEEEVVNYFEGIAACLDQRGEVGNTLKNAMEKISQG